MSRSIHEKGKFFNSSAVIDYTFSDVLDLPISAFRTFYALASLSNDYNEIRKLNISQVARMCHCELHRDYIRRDLKTLEENFFIKRRDKEVMISPVYVMRQWKNSEKVQAKWTKGY